MIFTNRENCFRLCSARAMEHSEEEVPVHRYPDMEVLEEEKSEPIEQQKQ
jgi:hypothetical protein